MSSMRKMEAARDAAQQAYTRAAAALVARRLSGVNEDDAELARLARRARAYEIQADAAARRVEEAAMSRGRA